MSRYDFNAQRLFVEEELSPAARITPDRDRAHYLLNVLRLREGASILLFNGRDGEWRAEIAEAGRKNLALEVIENVRAQTTAPDILYAFAPLKHARLDYMIQKAVEMGAARLAPVVTQHTQAQRVNLERMRANAIEAAEQCGVLHVPVIDPETKLTRFLESLDEDRLLVFCDEDADVNDPVAALRAISPAPDRLAVLIGPEGGFSEDERALILHRKNIARLSLGPRILRADTAAVAALTAAQIALGDWRSG
ncbi:16S rRNA (uracil(1498)-N(3))-methyltransferase [Terrarubrum flagellatum]|uniref:16S rRNA (uracil(1498)-N(3))-methyltransferase n=1 Tax=Terrirubrum flagellatum TaxID=2895980 RepID=UPI003144F257